MSAPVAGIVNILGILGRADRHQAHRAELERIATLVAAGQQRAAWAACAELRARILAGVSAAKAPSESLGGFHAPWVRGTDPRGAA